MQKTELNKQIERGRMALQRLTSNMNGREEQRIKARGEEWPVIGKKSKPRTRYGWHFRDLLPPELIPSEEQIDTLTFEEDPLIQRIKQNPEGQRGLLDLMGNTDYTALVGSLTDPCVNVDLPLGPGGGPEYEAFKRQRDGLRAELAKKGVHSLEISAYEKEFFAQLRQFMKERGITGFNFIVFRPLFPVSEGMPFEFNQPNIQLFFYQQLLEALTLLNPGGELFAQIPAGILSSDPTHQSYEADPKLIHKLTRYLTYRGYQVSFGHGNLTLKVTKK